MTTVMQYIVLTIKIKVLNGKKCSTYLYKYSRIDSILVHGLVSSVQRRTFDVT